MKLFSGLANGPLAEKIAQKLSLPLSDLEITIFPDGEKRIRVLESVISEKAIVVQPTTPPVDTNYMELFFIVDGLKRSGAEFVHAVVPYVGYQRQDHVFRDGEAVSLEVVAKTLESTGLDSIIVFDLHSIKIPEVFTIPVHHMSALSLFADKIKEILEVQNVSAIPRPDRGSILSYAEYDPKFLASQLSQNNKWKDTVLVSPDMGGIRRIKILSERLGNMRYAAIEKNRDLATGRVTANHFGEGSVEGAKRAMIVDDLISSGKTIATAAQVLKDARIEEMYVFATHAIFSEEAPSILQESFASKIFVTDTVEIPKNKMFGKLEILSVSSIIANEINSMSS